MRGFAILLRKELLESWRTLRLPVVVGLFLLVGLLSPLTARFLPEIIEAAAGDTLGSFPIPTPTTADAVDQLVKNLGQFGALAAILLAMGSVANETERGTAAFILAHPVNRGAFLGAKAAAIGIVLAVAVASAIAIGWLYTSILFEPVPIGGWIATGGLVWLSLAAWAALTFLASTVTGSAIAAAGLGFVGLLVLSIAAVIPAVARVTPAGLTGPALAVAGGPATIDQAPLDLWLPVVATAVWIAAALAIAALVFRRREI
jgi:ABC-2 type transport system permease protein